MVKATLFKFGT